MANVTVTLTGDEARILRSLDKVIAKERDLARAGEQAGRRTEAASQKAVRAQKNMGENAGKSEQSMNKLASSMLARFGSVAAVIGLATKALGDMDAKANDIAQRQKAASRGLESLAQLAGGDPAKMHKLVEAAKRTYAEGGAGDLNEAARTVFAIGSAGAMDQRKFFSSLYGVVDDPALMARGAATMYKSMGERETGSLRDIVSKAFAASEFSPASAEKLLQAGAKSGVSAKMLGLSDEEVVAATAMMATATGSAEQGGTATASLLKKLVEKGGFKGRSLSSAITDIASMGMSDPELKKYLGDDEAMKAFGVLRSDLPQLSQIVGAQRIAQETDLAGRTVKLRETVPAVSAVREARKAAAQKELAAWQQGIDRNRSEKLIAQREAAMDMDYGDSRSGQFVGWMQSATDRMGRWTFGDRSVPGFRGDEFEENRKRKNLVRELNLAKQQEEAAKRQMEAADKQARVNEGGTTLAKPDEDR